MPRCPFGRARLLYTSATNEASNTCLVLCALRVAQRPKRWVLSAFSSWKDIAFPVLTAGCDETSPAVMPVA